MYGLGVVFEYIQCLQCDIRPVFCASHKKTLKKCRAPESTTPTTLGHETGVECTSNTDEQRKKKEKVYKGCIEFIINSLGT